MVDEIHRSRLSKGKDSLVKQLVDVMPTFRLGVNE